MVAASYRKTGKTFSLTLKSKDAGEFGQFISSSLEAIYRAFKEAKSNNPQQSRRLNRKKKKKSPRTSPRGSLSLI